MLRKFKISENEWSSLGEEANGGSGGGGNVSTNTNNNEVVTNNLHLLAASAGLSENSAAGAGDNSNQSTGNGTTNTGNTPVKRRRRSSDADGGGNQGPIKMQTDVVRVPGLSSDLQQQITKFDSSEFDVSTRFLLEFDFLNGTSFLVHITDKNFEFKFIQLNCRFSIRFTATKFDSSEFDLRIKYLVCS